MKSKLIKRAITLINMILGVISRPTGSNRPQELLEGYIYIVENMMTGSIRIGSSISQNKIEDIRQTYYRSSKYMVRIIHKSCSSNHKDRQLRLQELKNYYYNMYSKNHIVLQI